MRRQGTFRRLRAAWLLAGLPMVLALAGCGRIKEPSSHRLVLIVDPTVLRDVQVAEFDRQLGDRLRASLARLPEDTYVELYFVGVDRVGLPVDYRGALPFDENEATDEGHRERARVMGDSVARLAHARWQASNEQPNDPSSCILTALYRAQEMTKLGEKQGESVTLVVVSDFLEACSDAGGLNFERSIPDSLGALPVQADLSGVDRALMLRMQTSGAVALKDEPRLIRLWTDVLRRWQVDSSVVEFTTNFPDSLVTPAARG